ncbi:MAG TPA: hypothetical protein VJ506_06145 [Candidatus Limnocylindrales bacterium]|nr:hypothetical protein [Candidatus Limnocylindrales bacterium]
MTRRLGSVVILASVLVIAGCGTTSSGSPGTGSSTSSSTSTGGQTSTSQSTGSSTATGPASSSIPGFDGWRTINPTALDIGPTQTGFGMTLKKRAAWSGTRLGVLFYTTMDGDFRLTATVRASRTSDSSKDPGGDGSIQMAGLMVRRESSTESWVLLEVGGDATGLAVATGSTVDGVGRLVASRWTDNEADLKICRTGTTFTYWKRTADSDNDWTAAGHVERKDLGGNVQVGASLSADATPDLTAFFDNLTLEPMDPGEAC